MAAVPRGSCRPGPILKLPAGFHPFLADGAGRPISSLLPGPLAPHSAAAPPAALRRWLGRTFPQTRGVPLALDACWTGLTAWSPDALPRIFEPASGQLALGCFSGEGNVGLRWLGVPLLRFADRAGLY